MSLCSHLSILNEFPDLLPPFVYRPVAQDARQINSGTVIPSRSYADQPYIVQTLDGAWFCVLTTGSGIEGSHGQHIISLRSRDCGQTWSEPVSIENPAGPEASWGVPLVAPSGRIFVFYVYNADNLRELPFSHPDYPDNTTRRMDSHGHYVFRWSDDGGQSWSKQRVTIPVREFGIDRSNSTAGAVRLFWNVGRPLRLRSGVLLPLHKVRGFGPGWFTQSEGAFVFSQDLLEEDDPSRARWETLPDGEDGLRSPFGGGPIAEEQSVLSLSDESIFCVYRSIDGHPVSAYSRDGGKRWEAPRYLAYVDGRFLKHPRAACFAWRLENGVFLLWFHNHGGRFLRENPSRADMGYWDRNPAWICRGWEVTTPRGREIVWGNPEVVLYDDDPYVRISYPDLVQEGGDLYITETQKSVARVHRLAAPLATVLLKGPEECDAGKIKCESLIDVSPGPGASLAEMPALPQFLSQLPTSPHGGSDQRAGFSIEALLRFGHGAFVGSGNLFSCWSEAWGGVCLDALKDRFRVTLSDGRTEFAWNSDPVNFSGQVGRFAHLIIIVDGGPKIVSFVVNGFLQDGGDTRQFGWGRFSPHFRGLYAGLPLRFGGQENFSVERLRIYPRALFFAEAEALFRAGPAASSGSSCAETVKPDLKIAF